MEKDTNLSSLRKFKKQIESNDDYDSPQNHFSKTEAKVSERAAVASQFSEQKQTSQKGESMTPLKRGASIGGDNDSKQVSDQESSPSMNYFAGVNAINSMNQYN